MIISFKTAKLAKEAFVKDHTELKYSCICTGIYWLSDGKYDFEEKFIFHREHSVPAPSQEALHKWLREKHGFHVICTPTVTSDWTFKSVTIVSDKENAVLKSIKSVSDVPPYKEVNGFDYSTYEKALEAGLREGLKLIK